VTAGAAVFVRTIPEALKAQGYSEDVIASRLLDAIGAFRIASKTSSRV
jgi:hypothetical protein